MNTNHLGMRLRALRQMADMTQERLGKLVGRTQQEIANWERHGRILSHDLPALSHALQVPLVAFFTEAELGTKEKEQIEWGLQRAATSLSPEARLALAVFLRTLTYNEPRESYSGTEGADDERESHRTSRYASV